METGRSRVHYQSMERSRVHTSGDVRKDGDMADGAIGQVSPHHHAHHHAVDMAAAYDRYHGVGYYARRYPSPNPFCLDLIRDVVAKCGGRVLDFGCGDGRYAAPLLHGGAKVLGYDVSHVAIEELSARCAPHLADGRLQVVCGDLDALAQAAPAGAFDVVVAMFGVLGHVQGRDGRQDALRAMGRALRPGGRLVVTVPSALRRFRPEQAESRALVAEGELEPGDILYSRFADGERIDLYYHLYQWGELEAELRTAGFTPLAAAPESMLPERGVVTSQAARLLERLLRAALPPRLAYGFLAVAEKPNDEPA